MDELTTVCPKCGATRFKVIPNPEHRDRIIGATCLNCNYFLNPLEVVEKSEDTLGIRIKPESPPRQTSKSP